MSYARMWTGAVDWKLDNMGVVRGWRKLRHMAPNAWTKVGDRDVYGYLGLLRAAVEGKWRVAHVKGHAERRKKRWEWSLDELSNDAVDKMAGRVRKAVTAEVGRWDAAVSEWQRAVDAGRADGGEKRVPGRADIARPKF